MSLAPCARGAATAPGDPVDHRDPTVRIARRLDLDAIVARSAAARSAGATRVVGVADVETTSLGASARVIELAVRRIRIGDDGSIVEVGRLYEFLEDPGAPLDPRIVRLTGLTDEALAGRAIDEALALKVIRSCECLVAHNCAFDAPLILGRLPSLAGQPFACSLREVDWRARGFCGALTLGCLLCGAGLFAPSAHRAGADVDATIALLAHRDAGGRTAISELLETAARPTMRFSAYGAAFGAPKDALKERGYRWDAEGRVWSREVAMKAADAERGWLADAVYADRWSPKAEGPHVETVDWSTRHV